MSKQEIEYLPITEKRLEIMRDQNFVDLGMTAHIKLKSGPVRQGTFMGLDNDPLGRSEYRDIPFVKIDEKGTHDLVYIPLSNISEIGWTYEHH